LCSPVGVCPHTSSAFSLPLLLPHFRSAPLLSTPLSSPPSRSPLLLFSLLALAKLK